MAAAEPPYGPLPPKSSCHKGVTPLLQKPVEKPVDLFLLKELNPVPLSVSRIPAGFYDLS